MGLNDPHALEEDIIYVIMQALCSQIGATMCACSSVGAPPHDTRKYYRSLLEVTELDLSSPFKPCSALLINQTVHCAEKAIIVAVHGFCVDRKGGTG